VVRGQSRLKTGAISLMVKAERQRAEFFALPVCSSMSAYGLIRHFALSPIRRFAPPSREIFHLLLMTAIIL
jgi:hypothetical protein